MQWSSEAPIDKSHLKISGRIDVQAAHHRFSCCLIQTGYCPATNLGPMSVVTLVTLVSFTPSLTFSPLQGGGIGWTGPVSDG